MDNYVFHTNYVASLTNTISTAGTRSARAIGIKILYDFFSTEEGLKFVNVQHPSNENLKAVMIRKGYEHKNQGPEMHDMIDSINKFLTAVGAPHDQPQFQSTPRIEYCNEQVNKIVEEQPFRRLTRSMTKK
jgi:hypothetical protein